MSQNEDPAEAATLPYDPDEPSLPYEPPFHDSERVEEHENHDDATLPVDPPTQESQPLYRTVLAHNPAVRARASPRNLGPDPREMLDREIANETEFGLNDRSPDTSQKSTLTDTQFSSPPNRLHVREYEGSDSSQILNELRRYTNPLNDLGSQDSIKTQFYADNYDRQHRMDIKRPRRSNSAIVDDGPEFKRQKHQGVYQQNSDLTDYLGNHYQAKCFFTDKQKALINPRFQMQKYPERERAKTFAGKLSATARLHGNATRAGGSTNSGIIDNLPPVTVEQLKYSYNLSLSSEDTQGSPESQRNPYVSPQRPYNRSQEDTSPLRYPSPNHPSSSGSSLGPSGREASTQSVSSHGRVSNMSDEVRAYQELHHQAYIHPEERFGVYESSDPGNDFADLGEFYRLDDLEDEPWEREPTPEIENSTIPREELQDYGPSLTNESDPAESAPPAEATSPTTAAEAIPPTTALEATPPTTAAEAIPPTTAIEATPPTTAAETIPPTTAIEATPPTVEHTSSTTENIENTTENIAHTTENIVAATIIDPATPSGSNNPKAPMKQRQKRKQTKGKERAEPPRRSSRIKEHTESADYKADGIKIMLSSAIEKPKRIKYKNFLDHKGAKTDDWEECTVYVSADITKDTTGSICALILGKDVVDSSWLDECIEEKAFTDYRCREFPRAKSSQQPMKGKKLYFTPHCGFTSEEKKLISKAVGATLMPNRPRVYHEGTVVVIKDSDDPLKPTLTGLRYKVTLLDKFIEPLARSL